MMPAPRFIVFGGVALLGLGALAYVLDRPSGYGGVVDFRAVLGPPPAAASAQAAAERAGFARTPAAIGGADWRAAGAQVFPTSPVVVHQVSCAIGRDISAATTPLTVRLMERVAVDLLTPVEAAKHFYKRDRPYVGASDTRTCDLRTLGGIGGVTGGVLSYSYPSGHAAYGALWAHTLAAAVPARAAAVTAWGRSLGDNRVTCRVHWPSDVAAGRRLGEAAYARLVTIPAFKADVSAASAELARAPPAKAC